MDTIAQLHEMRSEFRKLSADLTQLWTSVDKLADRISALDLPEDIGVYSIPELVYTLSDALDIGELTDTELTTAIETLELDESTT